MKSKPDVMPDVRPSLEEFNEVVQVGPSPAQLSFIRELMDWLDMDEREVVEMALDLIPSHALEGRDVKGVGDLKMIEASDLINELKEKKTLELQSRKGAGRQDRRRW